jgi:hypothetical protein
MPFHQFSASAKISSIPDRSNASLRDKVTVSQKLFSIRAGH